MKKTKTKRAKPVKHAKRKKLPRKTPKKVKVRVVAPAGRYLKKLETEEQRALERLKKVSVQLVNGGVGIGAVYEAASSYGMAVLLTHKAV